MYIVTFLLFVAGAARGGGGGGGGGVLSLEIKEKWNY